MGREANEPSTQRHTRLAGDHYKTIVEHQSLKMNQSTNQERNLSDLEQKICSLSIAQASRADHGQWMCLLNDITEFDTVRSNANTLTRPADESTYNISVTIFEWE